MIKKLAIDDPYVKKKEKELTYFLNRITETVEGTSVQSVNGGMTPLNLEINYIESPLVLFNQIKNKLKSLPSSPSKEEIMLIKALVDRLPRFAWCQIVNEDLTYYKNRIESLKKITSIIEDFSNKDSLSVQKLYSLVTQFNSLKQEVQQSIKQYEDEELQALFSEVIELIQQHHEKLFEDDPLTKAEKFLYEYKDGDMNLESCLALRNDLRDSFDMIRYQVGTILDQEGKNEANKQFRFVIQTYDDVLVPFLAKLQHLSQEDVDKILIELELKGYNEIEDKERFIKFLLEQKLPSFSSVSTCKSYIQQQLGLYLIQYATRAEELDRYLSLIHVREFSFLNKDQKKAVAHLLFNEYKDDLMILTKEEKLHSAIKSKINELQPLLKEVNKATTINDLKKSLSKIPESLNKLWMTLSDKEQTEIAKQLLMRTAVRHYDSIYRLVADMEQAHEGTLPLPDKQTLFIQDKHVSFIFSVNDIPDTEKYKTEKVTVRLSKKNEEMIDDTLTILRTDK